MQRYKLVKINEITKVNEMVNVSEIVKINKMHTSKSQKIKTSEQILKIE